MNTVTLKFISVDMPVIMRLPGAYPSASLSTVPQRIAGEVVIDPSVGRSARQARNAVFPFTPALKKTFGVSLHSCSQENFVSCREDRGQDQDGENNRGSNEELDADGWVE